MAIDVKHVEHVALLARLRLSEEEKQGLTADLNNILQYVEKINELDTSNVEPTSHILPIRNVVRADVVKPSPGPEVMLSNAPDREENFIKVPSVME
jgi:aspartyl-tRNA(Asn)/glutamyl-tRNA(Gln) amidotransferase subunit C